MIKSNITTAPSARRPFDGTGVRRISGRAFKVGLISPEIFFNLCREMDRLNIDILGLSDVRWRQNGEHRIDNNHVMYYSGSEESSNMYGVAVIIKTPGVTVTFVPKSNRAMMIQIQCKPRNLNILQLYAPTAERSNKDVEEFYKQAEQLLSITKKHDINIIVGDMNAKVGRREVKGIVGKYGLEDRNDRGDRLVQFCQEQDLVITNTYFQLLPRRLYTWTSPRHKADHIIRNQIDYILVNKRFRNCVKSAKTYPGADIRSDHNPVVAELVLNLKKMPKRQANNIVNTRKINDVTCKLNVTKGFN